MFFLFSILPTTLDSGFSGNTTDLPHSRISGPNTPTSLDVGPRFPPTPGVSSEGCRFQIPSPHTPSAVTAGNYVFFFTYTFFYIREWFGIYLYYEVNII